LPYTPDFWLFRRSPYSHYYYLFCRRHATPALISPFEIADIYATLFDAVTLPRRRCNALLLPPHTLDAIMPLFITPPL